MGPILVIDDDVRFRERLARAFRDRGIEAHTAGDGDNALRIISETPASRIVLDLRLEGESGLELLSTFLRRYPQLEIVVLTGYGSIATAVQALRLGARNYLTKPIDADVILNAFSGHTEQAAVEPPVPSLSEVEWEHIQRVLADAEGNVTVAAKRLGIHRRSLQRKLAKQPARPR